jgi:hypothetical protein
MLPDPDAEAPVSEADLVAQWREHIGTPFPSNYTIKFELQQRVQLHFLGEESVRAGRHPEFAEYRAKNAQRLFEILRTADLRAARLLVDVNYLECRLLRLTGKFHECRQLCQSMPVYSWDYAMLQEYIWASKGDDYPHERFRAFKDEEDKLMVQRFVQSAQVAYEEDLAQWTARREQETKPAPMSDRSYRMFMNGFVLLLVLSAVCATWSGMASSSVLVGVLVGGATFFVGLIALAVAFSGGGPSPRERIQKWENANPRPVSRISDKPDR